MEYDAQRNLTIDEPGPRALRRFRNMPPTELLLHFLKHVLRSKKDSERWRHDHPRTKEFLERQDVASCLEDTKRRLCKQLDMPEASPWFDIASRCREDSAAGHAAMDIIEHLARDIDRQFPKLLDEYRAAVISTVQAAGLGPRHYEGAHGGQHKEGYIADDGTFVSIVEDRVQRDGAWLVLTCHREKKNTAAARRREALRRYRHKPDCTYYSTASWTDEDGP